MINIAILGAGYIAKVHANAIKKINNAKIAAVADKDPERAQKFATEFGAEPYTDYGEILLNDQIDAVAICTPTFLHAEMVEKAANAKKSIFCEKPLALTNEDAQKMAEAIKENKVKSMVGHVLRFWPEYVRAKEILESRIVGEPLSISCERLGVLPTWAEGGWNKQANLGGGAALDLQIHDLDFLIHLLGEPQTVSSNGVFNKELGGWAHMNTIINFQNGKTGSVNAGWAVKGKFPFSILFRIFCQEGTIEWVFRAGENISETLDGKAKKSPLRIYKSNGDIMEEAAEDIDPFYSEWKYFIDCLDKGREIKNSTFEDGRRSLKLALATIESAKENKRVKF
ncbi:MAG: Gfo/Idh/MocA family oxidoreductase [Actinomycetota bacterium]|nr:Gfo/Idh/MocA family oxidoreductase [Actinomycetota bacterium]